MNTIKFGNTDQLDKNLLLKDLCCRLPYKPMVHCESDMSRFPIDAIDAYGCVSHEGMKFDIEKNGIKPYLFPLSNMTKEQFQEFNSFNLTNCAYSYEIPFKFHHIQTFSLPVLAWFLEHYFDINGLLEKDLAIDATGLNIYHR